MSTPASVKDEEGKDQTMNFSGNKSGDQQTKMSKEEEQEPSTAVIQMTIQPQPTSSAETQAAAPEALADAPAEIPLELLDAIPEVEPSEDLAFGIPEEAIVRPLERAASFDYIAEPEVAIGPFVGVPARRGPAPPPTSRPRFSYRSDAAQAQPSCSSFGGTAQSAHTYDYTDEPRTEATFP